MKVVISGGFIWISDSYIGHVCPRWSGVIGVMAAWRRAIELSLGDAETAKLRSIAQSRTEPANRVERARILLAYREDPSFFAVGRALGLHHQTVQRCVERAVAEGPLAALDDRPRPGREPTITLEAKAWLVSLACRKAKDLGYPHELWTTRLLARHAREHGPAEGHACLANLAQGTVCKILDQEEVKPHKVRYYLEQRDPDFAEKMAEVTGREQPGGLRKAGAASIAHASDAQEARIARFSLRVRSGSLTTSRGCSNAPAGCRRSSSSRSNGLSGELRFEGFFIATSSVEHMDTKCRRMLSRIGLSSQGPGAPGCGSTRNNFQE